ncbi:hypothetical protein C8F04DRAFT_1186981 [Mycena alexandri]|uniref:Uncharacterized protein n=1 Tax=Mycena alexandri TaxID=1745969 RepID=A0AAD6SMZ9_9AGAR|nr:hypothetical protein C8F04DRAFT_1186981 [Mycena alexandri]
MNFWINIYSRTYPTTPRKVWDERVRFSVSIAAPALRTYPTTPRKVWEERVRFNVSIAAPAPRTYPTTPRKVWEERVRFSVAIAAPALRYIIFWPFQNSRPTKQPPASSEANAFDLASASLPPLRASALGPTQQPPASFEANAFDLASASLPPHRGRTYPTTPRKVWEERVRFSVAIAAPALRTPRTTPRNIWDERVRFGVGIAAPALRTYQTAPRKVWDERVRFSVAIAAPAPRIPRMTPRKIWDERIRFGVVIAAAAPRTYPTTPRNNSQLPLALLDDHELLKLGRQDSTSVVWSTSSYRTPPIPCRPLLGIEFVLVLADRVTIAACLFPNGAPRTSHVALTALAHQPGSP